MIKGIILLAIVVAGPYALNSTDDMKARGGYRTFMDYGYSFCYGKLNY
jgi:hypothetical protein